MGDRLSTRQLQCVRLAGQGLSAKEIARSLNIPSARTVESTLGAAYRKLGVSDRFAAAEVVRRDYADSPLPIFVAPPPSPDRSGSAGSPDLEAMADLPWLARVWRAPPKDGLIRLGLIVTVAVVWILLLAGALTAYDHIFEVTDRFRPVWNGEAT